MERPIFPGYVFSRFGPHDRSSILQIPGFVEIVGIARTPAPLEDTEILALQNIACSGLEPEPWPFLRTGDRVVVERGPLSGLEGILVTIKNNYRIVVSVTLLRRSIAVEIDRDWVRAIPPQAGRRPQLLKPR